MSEESTNPAVERIEKRKENAVRPEPFLKDAGAIKEVGADRKLGFTADFADKLADSVEQVRERGIGETELGRLFGVAESKVLEKDYSYTCWKVRNTVYNWPSEGALIFDIAVDETLREWTDDWDGVPPKQRFLIAQSLRSFQDECLFCSGVIEVDDRPVESCCSERQVITMRCLDCDRRFLEFSMEE